MLRDRCAERCAPCTRSCASRRSARRDAPHVRSVSPRRQPGHRRARKLARGSPISERKESMTMYLPSIHDRAADAENMRVQKETRDRDVQAQFDWDKLIEL